MNYCFLILNSLLDVVFHLAVFWLCTNVSETGKRSSRGKSPAPGS